MSTFTPITQCDDDSYCCGKDNKACCDGKHGLQVGPHGGLLQTASTSSQPTRPTSIIITIISTPKSTPKKGQALSGAALGVGFGLALPLAVAVAVMGILLYLQKQRQNKWEQSVRPGLYAQPVLQREDYESGVGG